jgi:hypothetical protein
MKNSGKTMDEFTKGIQRSENINSTISYRETGCGIEATVTSGGGQYISNSYSNRDDARAEAAQMATDSLSFLYDDED